MNFFQPSFKLKEKRREGAKIIKHYHAPATPCERALAHPALAEAVKCKLRGLSCRLNPLAILAALRSAQVELGNRVDRQADQPPRLMEPIGRFAEALSTDWKAGERRAIHRRPYARSKPIAPRLACQRTSSDSCRHSGAAARV